MVTLSLKCLLASKSIQVFLNVVAKQSKIQLVDVVNLLDQILIHPAPKLRLLVRPLLFVFVSTWGQSVQSDSTKLGIKSDFRVMCIMPNLLHFC